MPLVFSNLRILVIMQLDHEQCYKAISKRDSNYDGEFFTCVKTTGIFCRPVCPANTPKSKNCVFIQSAAAALHAGYRPCLRCRPESAPNSPAWNGVKTTVSKAIRLIDEGALDGGNVDQLAERLGVSDRYLRHLFIQHVGVSPNAVARSKRILRAKQLITDTDFSMTEIAGKAGFSSIRQFNDTFKKLYGVPPSKLRKSK